jgi:flavin reductase (DIM6/NTAB) family NADH-FMN oxidoreductase RutF
MSSSFDFVLKTPTTALYPTPVVLVTCVEDSGRPNIITLAWVGVVCSEPPQIGIAIRPGRYSYPIIDKTKEFVAAIPTEDMLQVVDVCGTVSGRKVDKFKHVGLTPVAASKVRPPLIGECPVNLECVVKHKLALGTHDLFVGEVVAVQVSRSVLDAKGNVDLEKVRPLGYGLGYYARLGGKLQPLGFSARKKQP